MKKLMSLGCLTALIFAGASAFATDSNGEWFSATLPNSTTIGNGWTSIPQSWVLANDVGSFKDWDHPLTYQAATAVEVASEDATVTTSLKFTAIDGSEVNEAGIPVDLADVSVLGAKAGLTVVQTSEDPVAYSYYGLYAGNWVQLTGTPDLTKAVEVKIALCRFDTDLGRGAIVKYSADGVWLCPVATDVSMDAPAEASFRTIEFRGNCPAIASLNGKKFANGDDAKESINTGSGSKDIPATIQVSRTDLLERGIDPDNENAVVTYLTTKKTKAQGGNDQYGWVNVALGIDDTNVVAVASTDNTEKPGEISVNFGFVLDGSSTIQYVVDDAEEPTSDATISTDQSGIHNVTVKVKQGDAEVTVVTEQVGVMNTGKKLTVEEKAAKVEKNEKIYDIVAVPFDAFQGKVTVANVLNTAELTEGDTLYILNNNKYDTFALTDGKWVAVGETSYSRTSNTDVETKSPEAYELKAGQAIWIERNANSKIVFTGKGETSESHSWTWESGEYSLVANPTVKDFVLPTNEKGNFGKNGDMIIVEDVDNPKQFEKVNGAWGEWVTETKTVRNRQVSTLTFVPATETPCTIPAGIGFWYYNKGGDGAVTIDFGTNE